MMIPGFVYGLNWTGLDGCVVARCGVRSEE